MIQLGKIQTLEIVSTTDHGIYLSQNNGQNSPKVLLPKNQVQDEHHIGNSIEVFIYKDSEDRLIATTATPKLTLGKVALLQVKEVTTIGAFLEWGLAKDLLLPFKEQTARVHTGESVLVSLYVDKSDRLCATMKIYDSLSNQSPYKEGDRVIGTIYQIFDAYGAYVAVDNLYSGLISNKELFKSLNIGDSVEARITKIKEDGKLDLSIREKTHVQMEEDSQLIYKKLEAVNGFLPYHDKTEADIIKAEFNLSKNAFKRGIGRLMKEGKIELFEHGIKIKE